VPLNQLLNQDKVIGLNHLVVVKIKNMMFEVVAVHLNLMEMLL
jgi:hypothetical protein